MKSCTKLSVIALLITGAIVFASLQATAGTGDCREIQTDKGKITGAANDKSGVCSYLGVPYAAPPVGKLRFSAPVEHEPWAETLVADKYAEQCVQFPISLFSSTKITGREDCLYLNVWHPRGESAGLKPVMFFIHGGGFIYGTGAQDIYEGTTLAQRGDVVVVTINYRLGPFGFLAHPALMDELGRTGNYGIYDMLEALRWTKKNIGNFGGDPGNVTIFGESAGGISVGLLLASPLGKDLFHKAIIESGPVILLTSTLDKALEEGKEGAGLLGCADPGTAADCLKNVPAGEIMKVVPPTMSFISETESKGGLPYMPISGTDLLPEPMVSTIRKGDFDRNIPVILGSNKDEAAYFTASKKIETEEEFNSVYNEYAESAREAFGIDAFSANLLSKYPLSSYQTPKKAFNDIFCDVAFTCPTRLLAKQLTAKQPDVYLYHFVKSPQENGPMADWGAFHGSELAFVFGNFSFMGIKFNSKDNRVLASKMIGYWSSFARDGRPHVEGLPEWPRFTPEKGGYLELGNEIIPGENLKKEQCDIMEGLLLEIGGVK